MALVETVTALGGIKSALDILKAIKGSAATPAQIADIQSALIEAQQSAIQVQQAHSAQIGRIRELEEEISRLKAWEAEKQRYELKEVFSGQIALAVKEAARGNEPAHYICADCCNAGKKQFLQRTAAGTHYDEYSCNGCGQKLRQSKGNPSVASRSTRADYF